MYSSSESFAPLSRLLWKEYRAQRALWGAMFLFGVVPLLLIRFLVGDVTGRIDATWVIVAAAPMLFVVGSLAILFAGEREERTSDWLIHLSVPPLWLMLAKWAFVLISALALMASLSLIAVLLVWALPTARPDGRGLQPVAMTLWFFGGFVLWGSFGSLLSRRVITAVPAMGFWWLMTMVVPVIWLPQLLGVTYVHPGHERYQEVLTVLSFVVIGAADLWLGWRWCRGKYLDAQVFDDFHSRLSGLIPWMLGTSGARSRVPSRIEFANSWRREWQRLLWQERYRESYHRSLLYVGCVVGGLLAMLGSWHRNDLMSGIVPLLYAFPLAMGILGFRFDGEGQPLRFLANRGISPHVLWMAKHVIWLPRAFWIPLLVWLVAVTLEQIAPVPHIHGSSLMWASSLAWEQSGIVLWYVLLSYGCGHLAAMLMRRVILAIVLGVGLNVLAALWLAFMSALSVPLWWSMGGLAAWIFGLTWWLSPSWLAENRTVERPLRLASALIIPPMLLVGVVGFWRVYEVFDNVEDAVVDAEIARQSTAATFENRRLLDQLASTQAGFNTVKDFEQAGRAADADMAERTRIAQERFWKENESRLRDIMEITKHERGASPIRAPEMWSSDFLNLMPQQQLLLEAARLRTEENRLPEALDYYCACLRLATFWATDGPVATRRQADWQQLQAFQGIIAWANHPDQTVQSLRVAVRRVREEVALFPSTRETVVAEYLSNRRQLAEIFDQGWKSHGAAVWDANVVAGARYLPWERWRAEILLKRELLGDDRSTATLGSWLAQPGTDAARVMEHGPTKSSADKSRGQSPFISRRWKVLEQSLQLTMFDREVVVRESLLALSLLAWKLEHEQWPQSLGHVLNQTELPLSPVTIMDPWKGEPFEYHGNLVNRLTDDRGSAVLLSTVGPNLSRYVEDRVGSLAMKHWAAERMMADNDMKLVVVNGRLMQLHYRPPE